MSDQELFDTKVMARVTPGFRATSSLWNSGMWFLISTENGIYEYFISGEDAAKFSYSNAFNILGGSKMTAILAREEIWLIVHAYVSWSVNKKSG